MTGSEEMLAAELTSAQQLPRGGARPPPRHLPDLQPPNLLNTDESDAQIPTELCKGPISCPDLDETITMAKALPSASTEPGLALNLKAKVKGSPIVGWGLSGPLCF